MSGCIVLVILGIIILFKIAKKLGNLDKKEKIIREYHERRKNGTK